MEKKILTAIFLKMKLSDVNRKEFQDEM